MLEVNPVFAPKNILILLLGDEATADVVKI